MRGLQCFPLILVSWKVCWSKEINSRQQAVTQKLVKTTECSRPIGWAAIFRGFFAPVEVTLALIHVILKKLSAAPQFFEIVGGRVCLPLRGGIVSSPKPGLEEVSKRG